MMRFQVGRVFLNWTFSMLLMGFGTPVPVKSICAYCRETFIHQQPDRGILAVKEGLATPVLTWAVHNKADGSKRNPSRANETRTLSLRYCGFSSIEIVQQFRDDE
jgi:hypothetical protein